MRRIRRLPLVGLALVLSAVGCRARETSEGPTPPDVAPLRARYAGATGRLTPETAPLVAQGIRAKIAQLAAGQTILSELIGIVGRLDGENAPEDDAGAVASASPDGGVETRTAALTFSAAGWAQIRHICRGFSGFDPPDAARNGRIDLYATYGVRDFGDVIWGALSRCRLPAGADTEQELDGGVTLDLPDFGKDGGRIALDLTWLDPAGARVPFVLDFAFNPAGGVTVAQALPDGTHVLVGLRLDETAGSVLTVEDAGARWGCAVSVDGEHGECLRSALGAEVEFSW